LRRLITLLVLALTLGVAPVASAAPTDTDSLYLVGEFVDPVCVFQHGMQGVAQRVCAMVPGRVEQGMHFLDIREGTLYTVIGVTHWEDPKDAFLEILGDTVAVEGRVWKKLGGQAIAITAVHPYRDQPEPAYDWNPLSWTWEWSVLLGCGILLGLYVLAVVPLRKRLGGTEKIDGRKFLWFVMAQVCVIAALIGPIHDLGEDYLFSVHMVQHLLLALGFASLFIIGTPAWLWKRMLETQPLRALWSLIARPPVGFALYVIVFAIWHVPQLYNEMMRNHNVHILMHVLVMVTAVLMWWPILGGEHLRRPLSGFAKVLYLFLLGTPMAAVAAMITLAQEPLYQWYALAPRFAGYAAIEDQRLGGLIMWVPGALFWWTVMTVIWFRWASRELQSDERPMAPPGVGGGARASV
jgi:putative membrane protein